MRFLTNHSSGKMGYAIARAASDRGAEVTLVSGPVSLRAPEFVHTVPVRSAEEMYQAVTEHFSSADVLIMAAAVADYTPADYHQEKMKKQEGDFSLPLKRTRDILKSVGETKQQHQIICGFSMETENMLENSRKKLQSKRCDLIAANSLRQDGAGFGTDTNIITLISSGEIKELPLMSKTDAAHCILDAVLAVKDHRPLLSS